MSMRGAYNASKFAIEGFSDTMRLALAGTDIHVSLIEPGPIESQFRANAYRPFNSTSRLKTGSSEFRGQYTF